MTARTIDDLGDRLFATAPEAAAILGRDVRVVRRAAASGEIPATRTGQKWLISVQWIRQQAGLSAPPPADVDYAKLAALVNDHARTILTSVFARLAAEFSVDPGAA